MIRDLRHLLRRAASRVRRVFGEGPPADCGGAPRALYRDPNFAGGEVSPDQARIEEVLSRFLVPAGALLHVGTGSSSLARRFAHRLVRIDGVTVVEAEQRVADDLGIPHYRVRLCDKYAPELAELPGGYDVIVDNNLSSYACCRRHFHVMMRTYAALLAPGGVLLTEKRGMAFHEPHAFGLSWRELRALAGPLGLRAERVSATVYALRRVDEQ